MPETNQILGGDVFYTNPSFLAEVDKPKFTKEDYDKLDHATLVEYNIKKDKRIKRLKKTRDSRKAEAELYKSEMQRCMKRNERQKKDNNQQTEMVRLYKKLLIKLAN